MAYFFHLLGKRASRDFFFEEVREDEVKRHINAYNLIYHCLNG